MYEIHKEIPAAPGTGMPSPAQHIGKYVPTTTSSLHSYAHREGKQKYTGNARQRGEAVALSA